MSRSTGTDRRLSSVANCSSLSGTTASRLTRWPSASPPVTRSRRAARKRCRCRSRPAGPVCTRRARSRRAARRGPCHRRRPDMFAHTAVGQSVQPQVAAGALSRIARSPHDDAQSRDEEGPQEGPDRRRRRGGRAAVGGRPVSSSSRRATPAAARPPPRANRPPKRRPRGSRSQMPASPATGWRPPRPTAPSGCSAVWRPTAASADKHEGYDPAIDSWKSGEDLPVPVQHAMSVTWQDTPVVLGGWRTEGTNTKVATDGVWRVVNSRWAALPPLLAPRAACGGRRGGRPHHRHRRRRLRRRPVEHHGDLRRHARGSWAPRSPPRDRASVRRRTASWCTPSAAATGHPTSRRSRRMTRRRTRGRACPNFPDGAATSAWHTPMAGWWYLVACRPARSSRAWSYST